MTDRELRRLTREDLLDIIYELQQRTQRLEQENETIRKQLSDRTMKLENAGSIAEAALAVNGVFEAAQAAADQYLAQVRGSQQLADRLVADAQRKASAIVQQAQQEADRIRAGSTQDARQAQPEEQEKSDAACQDRQTLCPALQK